MFTNTDKSEFGSETDITKAMCSYSCWYFNPVACIVLMTNKNRRQKFRIENKFFLLCISSLANEQEQEQK